MAKQGNYIHYHGERLNLDEWTTMAIKAEEVGKSDGYIRKLKFRTKHKKGGEQIDYREITELRLTLVKK